MSWKIELEIGAAKALRKMDKSAKKPIVDFIDALQATENPREKGQPLKGELGEYWKYRVGNYRIIAKIFDEKMIIVLVKIGHRKDIYKK